MWDEEEGEVAAEAPRPEAEEGQEGGPKIYNTTHYT